MTQPDHEVVVIGAGISGIGVAVELLRAGIDDFVLLERADDLGGTWRDNTYPGVAVDVPAQAYQFSYALNPDWQRKFAEGHEVKAYIDRVADEFGVRSRIRFGCDVTSRTWDEGRHLWRLGLADGREVTGRFVVSAVGPFIEPKPVDIDGLGDFENTVIHSADWDHSVDFTGKTAAVIGTGASAVQIVPALAKTSRRLHVFQRTPIWVAPKLDVLIPGWLRWLYRRFPGIQDRARRQTTRMAELMIIDLVVHHHRVPWVTRWAAALLRETWYRHQVKDPETRRKLTPDYGLGCKHPTVSNDYLKTFNRPNAELVTESIERITSTGITTVDGTHRPIDILVLATGFRMASDPECYRAKPVVGRNGFDLAERYASERLGSYESISLPGLPNHFMIFGPYGWTGGTWHQLVEIASFHIVRVIGEARRRGATGVEVTEEAARQWTERMQDTMERSLWASDNCATARSWYFDHHGDTPFVRPTSSAAAWRAARGFPFEDYRFEHVAGSASPAT